MSGGMTLEKAADWVEYYDITFPVLADLDGSVSAAWRGGASTPLFLVLDRDLTVRFRGSGSDAHAEAEELVLEMLGE